MADWYVKLLVHRRAVRRRADARKISAGGGVLIEIYNDPRATMPDYSSMNPLLFHLAFLSDDLGAIAIASSSRRPSGFRT